MFEISKNMFETKKRCSLCREKLYEEFTIFVGESPICLKHLSENDIWTKIQPSPLVTKQVIALLIENQNPTTRELKTITDLKNNNAEIQNQIEFVKNENSNLKSQIERIEGEKKQLATILESDRKSIEKLMKLKNIEALEPVFSELVDHMYEIENVTKNTDSAMLKMSDEIQALKTTRNVAVADIKAEINNIKQALETNQASTISEIEKINEILGNRAETINIMLGELKTSFQNNNNSSKISEIEKKLEEINTHIEGLGAAQPKAMETPDKVEAEKEEAKPTKALKHEPTILKALETPKTPSELKKMGIPERSLYDTLKILVERGQIKKLDDGKYGIA